MKIIQLLFLSTITFASLSVKWTDTGINFKELNLSGHIGHVISETISSDNTFIVTGSDDNAKIWNASNGQLIQTLTGHSSSIRSVAISPDNAFIVTGSNDKTAKVWDASTGQLIHSLVGHTYAISSVAISPDNSFIVTAGSWDGTIKVWNASNGQLIYTLSGHSSEVTSLAISADNSFIASCSCDKTAKVWKLVPTLLDVNKDKESRLLKLANFHFNFGNKTKEKSKERLKD